MKKTVLFLGASHQQLAPIEYAKNVGYRIVTCDNRPNNPGHSLADKSYNVSTTDFQGVLDVAINEKIDAVVCYASDVATPTAAYISEKLGIPGNPLEAVCVLTNKMLFRQFQEKYGYFTPKNILFDRNDLINKKTLQGKMDKVLKFPVIVKPVDASGCKGVTKVYSLSQLNDALKYAREFSRSGNMIVEQLIDPSGYQVCGEGFLQDGKIIFHAFANEHFCPGFVVPVGESFPSIFDERLVDRAVNTLQHIFNDLNMRQGPFNFDLMFTLDGEIFVIEIGPRNGGNRIPEAIIYANKADTIAATVEVALGRRVILAKEVNHYYATYSIHAKRNGILESIEYLESIRKNIVDEKLYAARGDTVLKFKMGNQMLGCLILTFDTYTEMLSKIDSMDDHIIVNLT